MCYSLDRVYITGPEIKLAERVKNYSSLLFSAKVAADHLPASNFILDPESKRLSSASNSVLSLKLSPMKDMFHICYHTVATKHKWL